MILSGIDHIWSVGETFHRQEHAPGDGSTLLMACWYLDAFFPLLALGRSGLSDWMFYALALPVLLFFSRPLLPSQVYGTAPEGDPGTIPAPEDGQAPAGHLGGHPCHMLS